MVTIKDFIKENENTMVQISATPTMDEIGIFNEIIYQGMLYDISKKYHDIEVIQEGWLMMAKLNNLTVMSSSLENLSEEIEILPLFKKGRKI